jgi:hypothetical protein
MIAIYNRGGDSDTDLRTYELCINRESIATFTHNRGDGLAECLRKAANAVEVRDARAGETINEGLKQLFQQLTKMEREP